MTAKQYISKVCWQTMIDDVVQLTSSTYSVVVTPLNINQPGSMSGILPGYYIEDTLGNRYTITLVDGNLFDGYTVTVNDDFEYGFGPRVGREGTVFQSVADGDSPFLAPSDYRNLDKYGEQNARAIDLDILWRNTYKYWKLWDKVQYGYLYNSYAFTNISAVNAHVPTYLEWESLIIANGGWTVAGGIFKETGITHWESPNSGATNSIGLNILPSGYRFYDGLFMFQKERFYFKPSDSSSFYIISNNSSSITAEYGYTVIGIPIRLIVDSPNIDYGNNTGVYFGNDGRWYKIIYTSGKWWMTENLLETKYRDGSDIPIVEDVENWSSLSSGARCSYDNNIDNSVFNYHINTKNLVDFAETKSIRWTRNQFATDEVDTYATGPISLENGTSLFSTWSPLLAGVGSLSGQAIFLGQNAGLNSYNSHFSIFLGSSSGSNATNATQSIFIGAVSGVNATNSSYSVFMGSSSGQNATNASYSNMIGFASGYSASNASYSNFLGFASGYQASNASYSNLIGYQAGRLFTSNNIGSNNIIIGTNISLPNATANAINLGGVLFGTGSYSTNTGNPSIVGQSLGKVGVSIVTPTSRLHLPSGGTAVGTSSFKINPGSLLSATESGAIEPDGTHIYWTNSSGVRLQLDNGSTYSLPIATASILGGIKVGSGLIINSTTGVLSATSGGMVYPAFGIPVSTGTIWDSSLSPTSNALKYIRANSAGTGFEFALPPTGALLTDLSATAPIFYNSATGVISHQAIDGTLHVTATSTTNLGNVLTAGSTAGSFSWIAPFIGSLTTTGTGAATVASGVLNIPNNTYLLPIASSTILGGIKVGANLSIDGSGVLSASTVFPSVGIPVSTGSAWGTSFAPSAHALQSLRVNAGAIAWEWSPAISAIAPILYDNLTNIYSHQSIDGTLHVPATSTINLGKVLTAGATAGNLSWVMPYITSLTTTGSGGATVVSGVLNIPTSSYTYTLPIASSSILGGIKIGLGLSIDGSGILSSLITADNGLTANTSSNIKLGGTLLADTTINTSTFGLTITGSSTYASLISINSTVTGLGVIGGSSASTGTGAGGSFYSSSATGSGIIGYNTLGGIGGVIYTSSAISNTILDTLEIKRYTSDSVASGIGNSIRFSIQDSSGSATPSNYISSTLTTVLSASRISNLIFSGYGVLPSTSTWGLRNILTLNGSGQLILNNYGTNIYTGVKAKYLAVTSTGNVIESDASISLLNDVGSNVNYYPLFSTSAGSVGSSLSTVYTSSPNYVYNPINGTLSLSGAVSGNYLYATSFLAITSATSQIRLGNPYNVGLAGQVLTSGGPTGALTWTTISSGGSMTWPTGGAQIAYYSGSSSWGTLIIGSGLTLSAGTLSAAASSYTSNNGITLTSNNFQLGGSLLANTTIAATSYILGITGTMSPFTSTASAAGGIGVTGSGLGIGVQGISTSGNGIYGLSTSGNGVLGSSSNSYGGIFSSTSNTALIASTTLGNIVADFTSSSTSTNTSYPILKISRSVDSGNGADGIGSQIAYYLETDAGANSLSTILESVWTTAASALRTSKFSIIGTSLAISAPNFVAYGTGRMQFNQYGSGSFSSGTITKYLSVDSSGYIIEAPIPTSGGSYTFNNGLTLTGAIVSLGGTLLNSTTIAATSYTLNITGTTAPLISTASSGGGVAIEGISASGTGVWGSSTSLTGIYGTSSSGVGGVFISSSNYAIRATSTSSISAQLSIVNSVGNTPLPIIDVVRQTSGAVGDGIGGQIIFTNQTSTSLSQSNILESVWTTSANATRTSKFILYGINNAVTAANLTSYGNGQMQFNKYGIGTFVGTVAKYLAVDSSGNIIEAAATSGTSYSANNGLSLSSTTFKLGGTLLANTIIDLNSFSLTFTSNATIDGFKSIATGTSNSSPGIYASSEGSSGVYGITSKTGLPIPGQQIAGVLGVGSGTYSAGVIGQGWYRGPGVYGESRNSTANGYGVWGFSALSIGIYGESNSTYGGSFFANYGSTNNIVLPSLLLGSSPNSNNGIAGFGTSIDFQLGINGVIRPSGSFSNRWTNATYLFENSNFVWSPMSSGTITDRMTLSSTGLLTAAQYSLTALNTAPTSSTMAGTIGEIRWANGYVYLCVGSTSWQRAALTLW